MVSEFSHFSGKIDDQLDAYLTEMFVSSLNSASDDAMKLLDETRGPLVVTETMQSLGLKNTFISMYFHVGAAALKLITTPSNSRTDINTDPDTFIQTTPSDMGMLLEDIYLCAQAGGGSLIAVFPGQIDQSGCQQMIQYMEKDKLGALIQAGVPEGTLVAHKHGWDNYENQFSDAAIVYTPAGNYVLTIYSYNPMQFQWNTTSPMYAELSRAIYNFFNLPSQ
jgi:hypothetical protein